VTLLTEREIIDCLRANFRKAAEDCEKLARLPAQGPTYKRFREELKLIEGAARQLGYWRGDARWFQIGLQMEEAHQRAGRWIREKWPRPLFIRLAENLRAGERAAHDLATKATGRTGLILPKPKSFHRETRPVQVIAAE
jgi:hypothetical protein